MAESKMSLSDWYALNHSATPMTRAFLHGRNLLRVQAMLTRAIETDTSLVQPAPQPFTDQILSELMTFAKAYETATPTPDSVMKLNELFVTGLRDGLVWNTNGENFYQRWPKDGAPDPLNMPYATQPDREERNADMSAYMLTDPWGQRIPRF